MSELSKDIKEEIYKCSKCGLCRSVCPVFLATKNEMFLPRGRFIVLNNHINNSAILHKSFINQLDVCLNCNLCKDFCPSDIDSNKIFTEVKSKYDYKYGLIPFSLKLKFIFYLEKIKGIFNKNIAVKRRRTNSQKTTKVAFFEGCYNKFVNPSDKNAVLNILEKLGYQVDVISSCCGYPYISEGNIEKFKNNASDILKIDFSQYEYIICSCDTCYDTLNKFLEIIPDSEFFIKKLIRFDEFLKVKDYGYSINLNYLYFKPLIRKDDFTIKQLNKKGYCSLMENFFLFKYPEISKVIANNMFQDENELQNNNIITTCMLTKWGLTKLFRGKNYNVKVLTLAEYLDLYSK